MPSIQVTGQLVDPTTGVEGSADIRIASVINYGQTTKKSISHKSTDASGNYDFQLVHGKHLIFVKYEDERIYIPIGYAVVGDSTPDPVDLIQLINLSDENPPRELVTELQKLREDTLNDIVSTSAEVLESAGYKGLWPDTVGSALKGETWQTQIGGTPTGDYYTALKNTSVDPVGDNVNWRRQVSKKEVDAKMFTFASLDDAIASTDFQAGSTISLKERETGLGGGGKWNVVLASTVTPNTFDIVQCTGVPTLALVLETNAGQVILDKLGCYTASSDAASNQSALEFAMSKYDSLIMIGDYTVHNVKFPNRYLTFRALGRDQCFFIADTSSGDNEYFAAPVTWIDNLNSASERIKTHQVGFDGGTREITLVVHSFFCDFHDLLIRGGVNKGIFQTARSRDGTFIPTTMVNNRYHNPWVQGTSDIGFEIDEDGKSTDWQIFGGYLFNGGSKNFQARTMGGAVLQGVHMYGAPVSADLSKWNQGTIVNSCFFERDVILGTGLSDSVDFQFGPDNTVRGDLILNFGSVSAVRSHDNILTTVTHNYFGDRKFYSHGDTYRNVQPFSWVSTNPSNAATIRVTNALIGQESVSGELSPSLSKNTAASLSRDFGFGNGRDYTQVGSAAGGGAKSASITVPTVAGSNVGVGVNFKLGTRLNHSSTQRVSYKWEGVVYGKGGNTSIFNVAIDEVITPAEFTTVPTLTWVDNGDGTMTLTFDWEPATSDGYGGWNISVSGK